MRKLPPNRVERVRILNEMYFAYDGMQDNLHPWAQGNEEAGKRARVQSLKLEKMLKQFRKESVRMYKEKLSRLHGN